jgi:hypothetical protein
MPNNSVKAKKDNNECIEEDCESVLFLVEQLKILSPLQVC